MMTALLEYLDLPLYIKKLMMIKSFTHKLVLTTAHWSGLCWQFQKGFPEPL